MATIILNAMHITNFKGVRDLDIHFSPGQTDIYGDNATGKTTVYDAFTWALFGRDSHNQATFGIKPLAETGEVADHGVVSSVELTLSIDGEEYQLRKEYREKWTKKRGSSQAVFSGHETKCFVDGIPKSSTAYTAFIKSLIDEDTFRLMTSPDYFPSVLDWRDRRSILMKMAGDISPADVAASSPEQFDIVLPLIEKHGVEDTLAKLKAERTRLNKSRNELPIRIDEATRSIRDDINPVAERNAIRELTGRLKAFEAQISAQSADLGNAMQIAELKSERATLVKADSEADAQRNREWIEARGKYYEASNEIKDRLSKAERDADRLTAAIEDGERRLTTLREDYRACALERWTQDTVCPTCGQTLPDEMIEEKRGAWNRAHSAKLERFTADGKALAAQVEGYKGKLQAAKAVIASEQSELASLKCPEQPAQTPGANAGRIAELTAQIDEMSKPSAETQGMKDLRAVCRSLTEERAGHEANLAAYEAGEKTRARIKDFEAQEKKLAGEIEGIDARINACEEFTRAHAALVEDRINSMFRIARFKLFEEQINGGINDCCKLTANGVPWDDLNSAMRVNAGLDVIRTLGAFTGMRAPVFVDNAEGVTHIEGPGSQLIRLVVSEPDKTLRVQEVA